MYEIKKLTLLHTNNPKEDISFEINKYLYVFEVDSQSNDKFVLWRGKKLRIGSKC